MPVSRMKAGVVTEAWRVVGRSGESVERRGDCAGCEAEREAASHASVKMKGKSRSGTACGSCSVEGIWVRVRGVDWMVHMMRFYPRNCHWWGLLLSDCECLTPPCVTSAACLTVHVEMTWCGASRSNDVAHGMGKGSGDKMKGRMFMQWGGGCAC